MVWDVILSWDFILPVVIFYSTMLITILRAIRSSQSKMEKILIMFIGIIACSMFGVQTYRISQLNQREEEFKYEVSVDITYQDSRLYVSNKGKTNLFLWGFRIENFDKEMLDTQRVISTGGGHFIELTNSFLKEDEVIARLGENGQQFILIDVFVKDALQREHIIKGRLRLDVRKGKLEINTQNLGILQANWSK